MKNKAILFDLDGTLVDTAADFVRIIRQMCHARQLPCPSDDAIRAQVSAGARAMVSLFAGADADDAAKLALRDEFLCHYHANICIDSHVFAGVDALIDTLDAAGMPWGVVTNKPRHLAQALLSALALDTHCQVLVCPEDVRHAKPDPEGLLLAANTLAVPPENCLYIGDHQRDIEAGRAAGMYTIAAAFGYITPDESLKTWQADAIASDGWALKDLSLAWLNQGANA